MRAGAETLGDGDAELDDALRFAERQRLRIGIGADEVDPVETRKDHVVHGVAASAADTEYGDAGLQLLDIGDSEIDGHEWPHGLADSAIVSRQFVNRTLTIHANPLMAMQNATVAGDEIHASLTIRYCSKAAAQPIADTGKIAIGAGELGGDLRLGELLRADLWVNEHSGDRGEAGAARHLR